MLKKVSFFGLLIGSLVLFSGCSSILNTGAKPASPLEKQAIEQRQAETQYNYDQKKNAAPNHLALARPLVAKGFHEIALVQLKEAEDAGRNAPEIHYLKGLCLRETEQFKESEASFKKAIELAPGYALAHNGLGLLYDKMKRNDEALECYEKAIRLNPANPSFYNSLGFSLLRTGDCEKAAENLNKALALSPSSKTIMNNLGIAYGLCGDSDRELAMLKRAGSEADAYNNMGFVYELKGEYQPAMEMYQKAVSIDPDHKQAKKNLKRIKSICSTDKKVLDAHGLFNKQNKN